MKQFFCLSHQSRYWWHNFCLYSKYSDYANLVLNLKTTMNFHFYLFKKQTIQPTYYKCFNWHFKNRFVYKIFNISTITFLTIFLALIFWRFIIIVLIKGHDSKGFKFIYQLQYAIVLYFYSRRTQFFNLPLDFDIKEFEDNDAFSFLFI